MVFHSELPSRRYSDGLLRKRVRRLGGQLPWGRGFGLKAGIISPASDPVNVKLFCIIRTQWLAVPASPLTWLFACTICVLDGTMFPLTERPLSKQSAPSPAACPDGVLKNSKEWPSL